MKIIISGGGTGGHIFPAIAIANAIRLLNPQAEIQFVGAKGRMEMDKVPEAGYPIIGLDVVGFQRRLTVKNLSFPFKLWKSLRQAKQILKTFRPDVVVGVGGYASGPILRKASKMNIPCLIQEQNSFPGVTNKILAPKMQTICVAYDAMERFFPADKIVFTGNPIRQDISNLSDKRSEALSYFNVEDHKTTLLVMGGSLGARIINESLLQMIKELDNAGIQTIWQTGKNWDANATQSLALSPSIRIMPFIARMDLAYSIADVIVSRAGALSISELCVVGKPCILVPSPNVSEDHQTKNAMALVQKNAALMVADKDAKTMLSPTLYQLLQDKAQQQTLMTNILTLAKTNAAETIASIVLKIAKTNT
ncbi:UDP-N-acetylglucosamine--N-acetylmuramyl-(pentapeptide) pyrophosphoryl-undecaprenol N-acetylglucosamine transferase [Bacteroidia bacterium]|nr:UDP-N-acetylglucosamine--N-acetylmuramyl-(pentapeptide) pyrophosphoryl-undecaprenol N-acetylglucosamine transferase [Bacteroidia bacterium]